MKCHIMIPTFSLVELDGKVHCVSAYHLPIAQFSLEHLLLDDAVKHPSGILQCLHASLGLRGVKSLRWQNAFLKPVSDVFLIPCQWHLVCLVMLFRIFKETCGLNQYFWNDAAS